MIQTSELDPVISIRQNEDVLEVLRKRLIRLVTETKLDPEQFESFVGSLSNPVHLTQGPPGTGKSYLGVVIVRALLMIRSSWIKLHPDVGSPPILVCNTSHSYFFLAICVNDSQTKFSSCLTSGRFSSLHVLLQYRQL